MIIDMIECNNTQRSLYLEWKVNPNSDAYHLPFMFKIEGQLMTSKFIDTVNYLLKNYNAFRLKFIEINGNVYWEECESSPIIEYVKIANKDVNRFNIESFKKNFYSRKFDLNVGKTSFFSLVELENLDLYYFIFNCHHIIGDVYSFYQFFTIQLSNIYNTSIIPDFLNYSTISKLYLEEYHYTQHSLKEDNDYFTKEVQDCVDFNNIDRNSVDIAKCSNLRLDSVTQDNVKEFCKIHNISPFVFYLSCHLVFLSKVLDKDRLIVGIPIANRPSKKSKLVFGYFVNTLPLVVSGIKGLSFLKLIEIVKDKVFKLIKHKNANLKLCLCGKDMAFDNVFTYYLQALTFKLNECDVTSIPILRDNLQFPFSVIVEDGENVKIDFIRGDNIFSDVEVVNLYSMIMQKVLSSSECLIADYCLVLENEWKLSFNQINPNFRCECLVQNSNLFSEFKKCVLKNPNKVACVFEDKRITYKELYNLSVYYGNKIISKNNDLKRNNKIVLFLPVGIKQIIGIWATLYAGCIYVPVDVNAPKERIEYILEDTGADIILSDNSFIASSSYDILLINDTIDVAVEDEHNINFNENSVAYIIYTSGTTGHPKGVMVTHKNVLSLISSTKNLFRFDVSEHWSMLHSYAFDFSVWEIFGALLNQGILYIASNDARKSYELFWNFIVKNKISILSQTPSFFYQLIKYAVNSHDCSHLKTVVFGGEKLIFANLIPWVTKYSLDKVKLVNMYGITETTVHVSYYELKQQDLLNDKSFIGQAIPGWGIILLDSDNNLVPKGVIGEICVLGNGITNGYLNQKKLTDEKFIIMDIPYLGKQRIYKSGDIGRCDSFNQLEYIGRKDKQVKVRGYRIELKEIEAIMQKFPACESAAVKIINYNENDERIIGFFTSNSFCVKKDFKLFLGQYLPHYMIPFDLIEIPTMPLTINGKIDYAKLNVQICISDDIINTDTDSFEQAIEKTICRILKIDMLNFDDNFFDLGGNSLIMANLVPAINNVSYLYNYKKQIHIIDLYQYPTTSKLISYITKGEC